MVRGLNGYVVVEKTSEEYVFTQNDKIVFVEPGTSPIIFLVDEEEICFIHESNIIGELE